jgi:hypothetical protein
LAYAKRISRKPVDKARICSIGGAKFMGCGEFNPLSDHVRDQESRRAVVFVFDPAAEPQGLPCQMRSLGPCQGNCAPQGGTTEKDVGDADDSGEKMPPYRCKVYRDIAKCCPSKPGQELSHVRVRLHDSNSNPITTSVPYRAGAGSDANQIRTSTDGWVIIPLPKDQCVGRVLLEWGEPDEAGRFPYHQMIEVDCSAGGELSQQRARLHNIGYPVDTDSVFEASVRQFQADYGLEERGLETGAMPRATRERLWQIYENQCDATREPVVASGDDSSPDPSTVPDTGRPSGCSLL